MTGSLFVRCAILSLAITYVLLPGSAVHASTEVRITVTGFCTFIHDTDPHMVLTLMNARSKATVHKAVLIYDPRLEVTHAADHVYEDRTCAFRNLELKNDAITFDEHVETSPPTYDTSGPTDACGEVNDGSFGYVPHLRDLAKSGPSGSPTVTLGDVRACFVGATITQDCVAATFDVAFGKLGTYVANDVDWHFKTRRYLQRAYFAQKIAQKVVWTFNVPGDTLTLSRYALGANNNRETLLQVKSCGGPIDLTVANVTDEDIDILVGKVAGEEHPLETDDHFDMYYDFLRATGVNPSADSVWVGSRPMPLADSVCEGTKRSSDWCVLNRHVRLKPPEYNCDSVAAHPLATGQWASPCQGNCVVIQTIGGLNCGPDQIP